MNIRIRIFLGTVVFYAGTLAIGLMTAWRHIIMPSISGAVSPLELTWGSMGIFLAVFVVFTVLMVRFAGFAHRSLSFFLVVALVAGAQFVFAPWVTPPYDLLAAIAVAVLVWRVPRVLLHNIAVMLGIAGMAAVLGLSMTPLVAAVLLAVLSLYDIIAVYRTGHMVTLANRMIASGAVFGFLIPARPGGFWMKRSDALQARAVMMLGSGDIGLPLVLAASAVSQSITAAVMVAGFSLVGLLLMQSLFLFQDKPRPMAALPPIAAMAIAGYLTAVLLGI